MLKFDNWPNLTKLTNNICLRLLIFKLANKTENGHFLNLFTVAMYLMFSIPEQGHHNEKALYQTLGQPWLLRRSG